MWEDGRGRVQDNDMRGKRKCFKPKKLAGDGMKEKERELEGGGRKCRRGTVKRESGFSGAVLRGKELERRQNGCIQWDQEKTGMNEGTVDANVPTEPPGQSLALSQVP